MKSVLISIQPKWCELIASGKKTVEVRKTKPKIDVPFKCYIYCTKGKSSGDFITKSEKFGYITGHEDSFYNRAKEYDANGKVIGEFVCDRIQEITYTQIYNFGRYKDVCEAETRLDFYALDDYLKQKNGYGWHITDLVIYDKPKELSEFYVEGDCDCMNCRNCAWFDRGNGYNVEDDCNLAYKGADEHKSYKPIKRPPQSWCYVEVWGFSKEIRRQIDNSTADVVPKSEVEELKAIIADHKASEERWEELYSNTKTEVAREIFEEIETLLDNIRVVTGTKDCFITVFRKTMEKVRAEVAELKKKYTEEKKDEN